MNITARSKMLTGPIGGLITLLAIAATYTSVFTEANPVYLPFSGQRLPESAAVFVLAALGTLHALVTTLGWNRCVLKNNHISAYYLAHLGLVALLFVLLHDSGVRYGLIVVPLIIQTALLTQRWRVIVWSAIASLIVGLTLVYYNGAILRQVGGNLIVSYTLVALFAWITLREEQARIEMERLTAEIQASNDKLRQYAREEEARMRELGTLLEVSHVVGATLELQPLLKLILEQLKRVVEYHEAAIITLKDDHCLSLLIYEGSIPQDELRHEWPLEAEQVESEVIHARKPVIVSDLWAQAKKGRGFCQVMNRHDDQTRSWMGIPLVVRDQVVGVIEFDYPQPGFYSHKHADLAFAFANQAAVAIDNARLYAETRKRVDEMQALFGVQQALTSRLDRESVLQRIVDEARLLTNTNRSVLALIENGNMRIAATSGEYNADLDVGDVVPMEGTAGEQILQSRKPTLYTNVADFGGAALANRVKSEKILLMPLLSDKKPIGLLSIADKRSGTFGAEDERLLTLLASGAVIALENARLYREERERRQEAEQRRRVAESLREMLNTLNSNRPVDEILTLILDQACSLLDTRGAAIYRLDGDTNMLVIQAARGLPETYVEHMSIPLGQGIIGRAVLEHQPMNLPDLETYALTDEAFKDPERFRLAQTLIQAYRALLAVPLFIKDEVYGGMVLYYPEPRQFTADEIRLATTFGDQAALAIENARLRTRTEQAAASAERQRLARELHDAVTQTLFSASLIAEILPRLWQENPAEGEQRLQDLRRLTRGALAEMRTLLLELRPTTLVEMPLADLVRQLVEALTGRTRLTVELSMDGSYVLPPEVQINLYRIAQESLNNILKHAKAKRLCVSLHCQPERVQLEISDDGRGFDSRRMTQSSFGLNFMRERAAAIGAQLRIESQPGQGTQVAVIWSNGTRSDAE